MKKDTKNILMIAGLGVAGFVGYNWWKKRQAAAAEEAAYMPPGYGGEGPRISILWGGEDTCGPCNEGTPEEGDVTTARKEGGVTPEEPTPPTVPEPYEPILEPPPPTAPEPVVRTPGPIHPSVPTYPRGELDVLEDFLRQKWPVRTVSPFGTVSPTTRRTAPTIMGRPSALAPSARGISLLPRQVGIEPERPITPTATLTGRPSALAPSARGISLLPRQVGIEPERPITPTATLMGRPSALAPGARGISLLPRRVGIEPERQEKKLVSALAQNRIKRSTGVAGVAASGGSRRWIR